MVKNEATASFISKNEGSLPGKAHEVSDIHEDSKKQMDYFNENAGSDKMLQHAEVPRLECSTYEHSMAVLLDDLHRKIDQPLLIKEIVQVSSFFILLQALVSNNFLAISNS